MGEQSYEHYDQVVGPSHAEENDKNPFRLLFFDVQACGFGSGKITHGISSSA
jgi:hypothetical protein